MFRRILVVTGSCIVCVGVNSACTTQSGYEPLQHKNMCWTKKVAERPSFRLVALLTATKKADDGSVNHPVRIVGGCKYVPDGAPDIGSGGGVAAGWNCSHESYGHPPERPAYYIGSDFRGGYASAQSFFGTRPPVRVEKDALLFSEFALQSSGSLQVNCKKPFAAYKGGELDGCTVVWRSSTSGKEYSGICGERVPVPGLYIKK